MPSRCATGEHAHHDVYSAQCPCRDLLDLLANKWSALAVGALEDGPQRFGQLQRHLRGISPKVLTQTLRRLTAAGLLIRTVYPAVPLHVEYALTDLGYSAAVPMRQLRTWAEDNLDAVPHSTAADAEILDRPPSLAQPKKAAKRITPNPLPTAPVG